ncbi:endonuclease domain-containing protein [Sphingomonas soli]|uniref:endonuclease domain-containing protein n=1 Tax=Sphingomonas soli TaxID=266127 RepID=UPI00082E2CE9|nr:endonuclease domain-containing protein [Sphingomonas soli]
MLHGPKRTQILAQHLRRTMSLPEALLWRELRRRPAGHKFRRQHPAGRFVLDFYCAKARLAIEVDGEIHARGNQPERDATRDAWLRAQGVGICRIPAREVLEDMDAVIRHIIEAARGPYPSTASGGPPPPPGED